MESKQDTLSNLDELTKVNNRALGGNEESYRSAEEESQGWAMDGKLRDLHPYAQTLTLQDVPSCVALENAAFVEPDQRCSKEKVRSLPGSLKLPVDPQTHHI
jgi:hypothetical protein